MLAVTRRPYRSRAEGIEVLKGFLSHGPLSTSQICVILRAHRNTALSWLGEAEREGEIRRVTVFGKKPTIWALPAPDVVDPAPEGPRPFEDLVRKMTPGRWHTATELSAYRDQLALAVEADLLETCRRWYEGRPGRKATLYKLTVGGELAAGCGIDQWGFSLRSGSNAASTPPTWWAKRADNIPEIIPEEPEEVEAEVARNR